MFIAISGSFGSGKSSVRKIFEKHSWQTLCADEICHAALPSFAGELAGRWGKDILDAGGAPDRKKIAAIVFNDPAELAFLEGLLAGKVRDKIIEMRRLSREEGRNIAFEVPLLYERSLESFFDKVVAVYASLPVRTQRLAARGFTPQEVAAREAKQLNPEKKLELADYAVINNFGQEYIEKQIILIIELISKVTEV